MMLTWPPDSPDLNPVVHLWHMLDKPWSPTSQLTELQGSATNVLVVDTTEHLQISSGGCD